MRFHRTSLAVVGTIIGAAGASSNVEWNAFKPTSISGNNEPNADVLTKLQRRRRNRRTLQDSLLTDHGLQRIRKTSDANTPHLIDFLRCDHDDPDDPCKPGQNSIIIIGGEETPVVSCMLLFYRSRCLFA